MTPEEQIKEALRIAEILRSGGTVVLSREVIQQLIEEEKHDPPDST